ncbi:MAG: DUF1540 domain-containing protein [Oscillospiraceae bacterium]
MDINQIKCEVNHCKYHDGKSNCTAETVKVGCADACNCDETKCATFTLNKNMK